MAVSIFFIKKIRCSPQTGAHFAPHHLLTTGSHANSQYRLYPLARHRTLRPTLRPRHTHAAYPAVSRGRRPIPPSLLRQPHLLAQPRLPAHRPVGPFLRHDWLGQPRLDLAPPRTAANPYSAKGRLHHGHGWLPARGSGRQRRRLHPPVAPRGSRYPNRRPGRRLLGRRSSSALLFGRGL